MEEIILKACQEIVDCTVFGVPDKDGFQVPIAVVKIRAEVIPDAEELLRKINQRLFENTQHPLGHLKIAFDDSQYPTGATGKVLKRQLRDQYSNLFANS